MEKEYKLTTIDNPYSPFTQHDEWFAFDLSKGYHTPSYLARIVYSSMELSQADEDLIIQDAIKEIVELNVLGIYRRVLPSDYP